MESAQGDPIFIITLLLISTNLPIHPSVWQDRGWWLLNQSPHNIIFPIFFS